MILTKSCLPLTLSLPNFRRHLSSAFFFFFFFFLTKYHLERCFYVKLKDWLSNSLDPDETAHYEPCHLDLCCLQKPIIIACGSERVKGRFQWNVKLEMATKFLSFCFSECCFILSYDCISIAHNIYTVNKNKNMLDNFCHCVLFCCFFVVFLARLVYHRRYLNILCTNS